MGQEAAERGTSAGEGLGVCGCSALVLSPPSYTASPQLFIPPRPRAHPWGWDCTEVVLQGLAHAHACCHTPKGSPSF